MKKCCWSLLRFHYRSCLSSYVHLCVWHEKAALASDPKDTKFHSLQYLINVAHLFDSVQRGSYGYDWHENNGRSIVVILIGTPQDNTEELEDVERIEDLQEEAKWHWVQKESSKILLEKKRTTKMRAATQNGQSFDYLFKFGYGGNFMQVNKNSSSVQTLYLFNKQLENRRHFHSNFIHTKEKSPAGREKLELDFSENNPSGPRV